jgi:hypothetical protein
MTRDPKKLIDEYLERVEIYLPQDSDDVLVEIRTHLLEEAETLGNGQVTVGSVTMAIERLGSPQTVASEYAGTGTKVGPVPREYALPVLRLVAVLLGISVAFLAGALVVGSVIFPALGLGAGVQNFPLSLPVMIVANVIFGLIVAGAVMAAIDRQRLPTEKTFFEGLLGIGVQGLKPKPWTDAAGEFIGGYVFGVVLLHPLIQPLYSPAFAPLVGVLAALSFIGAFKGALFLLAGENNANLILEAVLGAIWVFAAMVLFNVGWPLRYVYANTNGVWHLIELVPFFVEFGIPLIPLDALWAFIIFLLVVGSVWHIIVASMKVPMYLRDGKGLWWQSRSAVKEAPTSQAGGA